MAVKLDPYDAFRQRVLTVVALEGPVEEDKDTSIVESVTLYYTNPATNNDKIYKVWIRKVNSVEFSVMFAYGRRGSALKEGTKFSGSLNTAKRVYDELVTEKKDKGYTEEKDGGFK